MSIKISAMTPGTALTGTEELEMVQGGATRKVLASALLVPGAGVYGGFSHLADQTFSAGVSAPIAFNTNNEGSGITHSETVDNEVFEFDVGGVYQLTSEPQYTRSAGSGTDALNMYIQKDTGSGFANVANSNIKVSINTTGNTDVAPLTSTFRVASGDKIRFMINVETANLKLDFFAASGVAPNDIPATPSVIMNIARVGD